MPRRGGSRRETYAITDILASRAGELTVAGTRGLVLTESAFTFMQQVVAEQMPEMVVYGFYEMGYRTGLDLAEGTPKVRGDREEAFRFLVETYRQAGYGDIEVVRFDLEKAEALLRGRNLIESAAARRSGIYRSPRCVDHYSRGMFAGMFSRLLGKEVVCEELACEFRGDPACEFVVLPFGGE